MDKPDFGQGSGKRCVARTQSIQEAEEIARRHEGEGFDVEIRRIGQAGITVYEVWAGRKPDIFSAK